MSTMLAPALNLPGPLFAPRGLQHTLALTALTALGGLLFFYRLDDRALWSSHEGRAGQNAQLMLDSGQWGMPRLYAGWTDYQKPPLYYWLVAGVAWLRGGTVDAWAIRFPAAAAALGGIWVVYLLGSSMWRPAAGFVAALMLAANLRYAWLARVGRIDMPLTLAVLVTLACFWMAYRRSGELSPTHEPSPPARRDSEAPAPLPGGERGAKRAWGWLLGMYLACAAAVMLKGPVGLVLPLVSIVVFLVIEGQPVRPWRTGFRRVVHSMGLAWGVPLVAVVAGPWFVWATLVSDGEFFRAFVLHHNWDRTLGAEGLKPGPVWYYVPQMFADLFPWSLLVPAAVVWAVRQRAAPDAMAARFGLSWSLAMFIVLSLVRFKRHDYVLPVVPGLALLLAGYWDRLTAAAMNRAATHWTRITAWSMAACVGSGVALMLAVQADSVRGRLLEWPFIERLVHEADRVLLSRLVQSLAGSAALAAICGAALVAAVLLGVVAVYRRRLLAAWGMFAAAWAGAFLFYVDHALPAVEPLREQRTLAQQVRRVKAGAAPLYYYGREDQQLLFYLGPGIQWLPNRTALRQAIERPEPVFVVVELDRFLARRTEWPNVTMIELARNTDNVCGTHCEPAVLVTNDAGWRLVQARAAAATGRAN